MRQPAEAWRAEHRIIDLHQHINGTTQHLARAIKIMDAVGLGLAVNLSGATVSPGKDGGPSQFERNQQLADALYPGRFLQYMSLDYRGWDQPDFAQRAVQQIEAGHRLGAAGFKEFKRLGLYLRDGAGKLIRIDDPKLDPMWKRCGELNMPVSIHVADPKGLLAALQRPERALERTERPQELVVWRHQQVSRRGRSCSNRSTGSLRGIPRPRLSAFTLRITPRNWSGLKPPWAVTRT